MVCLELMDDLEGRELQERKVLVDHQDPWGPKVILGLKVYLEHLELRVTLEQRENQEEPAELEKRGRKDSLVSPEIQE